MPFRGMTSRKLNLGIGQTIQITFERESLIYQTGHRHTSTSDTIADPPSTFC